MAEDIDLTTQKTLRLKKTPAAETGGAAPSSVAPAGTVPAVMGRPQAAPVQVKSNKTTAILALVATLVFAALVLIQVMELQAYKYSFPRPQLQAMP